MAFKLFFNVIFQEVFMSTTITILDTELEYDFLSAWIKYTRIKHKISQEALAYGICSVSHLSYFENGKKHLRTEIIEALLKRLNIAQLNNLDNIGLIRQKLYKMMNNIESFNYDGAMAIYDQLIKLKPVIELSPYNMEFKIYELMYKSFVLNTDYHDLKDDLTLFDKIIHSLNKNMKYLYSLVSGNILYSFNFCEQGLAMFLQALALKDSSWINYLYGRALCFHNDPAKGSFYLEKALDNYEKSGNYLNAIWCHNYLGVCFSYLKIYDSSIKHFDAALMSAEVYHFDKLYIHLYTNLSHFYYEKGEYEESLKWSQKAIRFDEDAFLASYNYIMACIKLNITSQCNVIFEKYLTDKYKNHKYYKVIYFQYLLIHHFHEEIFYNEVKNDILPYYENVKRMDICKDIKLKLIEYLEDKRKYKEANKIYKDLLHSYI